MLQSKLFSKTSKQFPEGEETANAKLLIRGGFIHKVMAGVYAYLPLGLRVLERINRIIRDEMNATGAEELHLSVLQNKETWEATGRWNSAREVMYQFKDHSGRAVGLGWTHEEPLTELARHHINSYRDLPKAVYQIQTKFRNEPRPRSGLLRGREFLMKDLYSFHANDGDLDRYYERVAMAYASIFRRASLPALRCIASGGLFSKYSDEFQVITAVGEDTIYHTKDKTFVCNKEVHAALEEEGRLPKETLIESRAIEVGNIFKLGTRFSEAFGFNFTDRDGSEQPVVMASYGIGPGRLMATIVELHNDKKGIIWPDSVAPFVVHLIELGAGSVTSEARRVYDALQETGVEVLYDDRVGVTAGEKFADADILGAPYRAVVSDRTGSKVEVMRRDDATSKLVIIKELISMVTAPSVYR